MDSMIKGTMPRRYAIVIGTSNEADNYVFILSILYNSVEYFEAFIAYLVDISGYMNLAG